MRLRDLMEEVFASAGWREVSLSISRGLGVSVLVLDSGGAVLARAASAPSPCASDAHETCGVCGDTHTGDDCVAGLASARSPIRLEGEPVGEIVLGGFLGASRDRENLSPRLRSLGVDEELALSIASSVPVYSAKRAQALADAVAIQASSTLASAHALEAARDRAHTLDVLIEASADLGETLAGSEELPGVILSRAAELLHAEAGALMLLRKGSDILDNAARFGVGEHAGIRRTSEPCFREAAASGAPALCDPEDGAYALVAPLLAGTSLLGMLRLERDSAPFGDDELLVIERFAAFAASSLVNATCFEDMQRDLLELTQLEEVALSLHGGLHVSELAPHVASILEKSLEFTIGGVVLTAFGHDTGALVVRGDATSGDLRLVVSEALGVEESECDLETFTVSSHLGSVNEAPATSTDWCVMESELMVRDMVIGYLFAAVRGQGAFDHAHARLLRRVASHAALSFDRAALLERVRSDFAKTIAALSAAMDAGERMERGHTDRVMEYAMALGEELGLGPEQIEILRFAGLLHDVGKVGLSEEILVKPAELNEDEWARIRKHSEIGAGIVSEIRFLNAIAPVILHHHERWDGKGYPMGLRGTDTPLLARILGVCDAYDAMCSDTSYRAALSPREARAELERGAGSQFDPEVVAALLSVLDQRAAAGATGLLGVVSQPSQHLLA